MIIAKRKVNYQKVYDLYQLCSETKDLLNSTQIMEQIIKSL